jgi:hypothetical protein
MTNDKKSIMKEAITDFKEIMEAADANAKKKLAEEFPEKFNNLLKEELNKNKSAKESYKKLDEGKESEKDDVESNKDTVMKNQKEEAKKAVKETAGEGKPFDKKAKEVAKVEEDVKIVDTVGDGDPFEEKAKGVKKVDETVKITDTVGEGDPFKEKAKKAEKPLQKENFDMTGQSVDSVGTALEGADEDDEIITMDEIEQEIANMENLDERLTDVAEPQSPSYMDKGNKGVAFDQLVNMRNQIDEMIKGMGQPVEEMHAAGQETFGDNSQVDALHNQGPTEKLIDELQLQPDEMSPAEMSSLEEEAPITDADVEAVLGAEKEVDEAHGVAYNKRRPMPGRVLPGQEYLSQGEKDQSPEAIKESKKLNGLIEENKKLTKKLNETNKFKKSATTLIESYKTALDKYRNQLKEMAVFNTNLAHVNNLLVNETLALTQDDKIKIINEFKKVDSIAESQKKYQAVLSEMKSGKKTLTESIEDKVSASIQPSSKQKLEEAKEVTAYENNDHMKKMKRIIEYVEHRGKKNNL